MRPNVVSGLGQVAGARRRRGQRHRGRAASGRSRVRLFVAGFATVSLTMGATASAVVLLLRQHLDVINLVSGAAVVVLGLALTGLLRIPLLQRQARFDLARIGASPGSAFSLGAAFAF